jgi:hypothetical protein
VSWFGQFCSSCINDSAAAKDIQEWGAFLEEVVLDRCSAGSYSVDSYTAADIPWPRVVRFLSMRGWDPLLDLLF